MTCFFSITPYGVRAVLKKDQGPKLKKRFFPTLKGWENFSYALAAHGVRLVAAPSRV